MEIATEGENTASKTVGIEFVHNDDTGGVPPFFGNKGPVTSLSGINIADDTVGSDGTTTLGDIIGTNNCLSATCSLKLSLIDTAPMIIPVSFSVSTAIPDLNAVIVADGISPNTTYHSRIIELIPLIQGI